MTERADAATVWRDQILPNVFGDKRFQWDGKYRGFADINGVKGGIALATRRPQFSEFALDKVSWDRLLAGKRCGKIDVAFLVRADVDANGVRTYRNSADAEKFNVEVVQNLYARNSAAGPFYILPSDPDDAPF